MSLKLKKKLKVLVPEGLYKSEVIKIEEGKSKFEPDKNSVTLWFRTSFRGLNNMDLAATIPLTCTASLHEKSRLTPIIETLMGRKFNEDEEVDLDEVIGKRCRVHIQHRESVKTGKTYSQIESVLPLEDAQ